jgi:hypothetical protein
MSAFGLRGNKAGRWRVVRRCRRGDCSIDVVGPDLHRAWTVAAIGGRPTTPRRTVERELATLGLRRLTTKPIKLPGNSWQQVGAEQLFLRLDPHEGDASFEMFGDLKLRCSTTNEVMFDVRGAGLEIGEVAWVFRSPDSNWLAVSIVGEDGGEDTADYTLDTVVIDVRASCLQHRAVMWKTTMVDDDERA